MRGQTVYHGDQDQYSGILDSSARIYLSRRLTLPEQPEDGWSLKDSIHRDMGGLFSTS